MDQRRAIGSFGAAMLLVLASSVTPGGRGPQVAEAGTPAVGELGSVDPATGTDEVRDAAPRTGIRRASSDFDGDGYPDLAVGAPTSDPHGIRNAGAVEVFRGSRTGLMVGRSVVITQDTPGIPGKARRGDQFGYALANGDLDGDGYADLAVSARYDDEAGRNAGGITILFGSPQGLTGARSQRWDHRPPGGVSGRQRGVSFGWAMLMADFDADGRADLAVGVPNEVDAQGRRAGAVHVLYGVSSLQAPRRTQRWTQDSPGILDRSETGDTFGRTLTVADFDGDGFRDLAVAAPYESHGGNRVGRVHVIHGSRGGLTAADSQVWDQDTPGILEQSDLRDEFGMSLAAADFDADGFGDLAVGVWFEDGCWICNEGRVAVLYGTRRGLTAARNQSWSQDSPGIADQADVGDQFGQVLVAGDTDGDGFDDLVVGVPWEDFNERNVYQDRGALHVLHGSDRGLTAQGSIFLHQDSPGISDQGENHDHFGDTMGLLDLDGDGDEDLMVGVPWESLEGEAMGLVQIIDGGRDGLGRHGDRLVRGLSGASAAQARPGDRYGWALSTSLPRSAAPRTCGGSGGGPC